MNKRFIPITALFLSSLLLPIAPARAGHDMAGMEAGGNKTIMLETAHQDGVMAMVHLTDTREAMAKHGMKETHHLMAMFSAMSDGKAITEGTAAVKITDPAGTTGAPIKMMAMTDGFGADVSLPVPGKYRFEIGTKLADGKKRVFTYTYDQK